MYFKGKQAYSCPSILHTRHMQSKLDCNTDDTVGQLSLIQKNQSVSGQLA